METSEAFMLRKNDYSEADYIVTFLTRDFGKVTGLAKNAKKSRKRFGGRLEPFVHLNIRFRSRPGGMKFIEDSHVIRAFSSLMEDVELFTWGSFVLENIDIFLPEDEPNKKIFDLLVETLSGLDSEKNPLAIIPKFQLSALSVAGYKPNLDYCLNCDRAIEGSALFSIKKGGVLCSNCGADKSNRFLLSRDILFKQDLAKEDKEAAFNHITLFAKFTEYHTGKEIKSSKFLGEIMR